MHSIDITTIRFPDITLRMRDGHKLRGYFGNVFKEHSLLLHNHLQDGSFRQSYPLVQYKVLRGTPTLVGLGAGSTLLETLFSRIKHLDIDGIKYPISRKDIATHTQPIGITQRPLRYRFQTLWMALNEKNYAAFCSENKQAQHHRLAKILTGNILMFFREMEVFATQEIVVLPQVYSKSTRFKDIRMIAFEGGFTANVLLPNCIGLGKSAARGFGSIQQVGAGINNKTFRSADRRRCSQIDCSSNKP